MLMLSARNIPYRRSTILHNLYPLSFSGTRNGLQIKSEGIFHGLVHDDPSLCLLVSSQGQSYLVFSSRNHKSHRGLAFESIINIDTCSLRGGSERKGHKYCGRFWIFRNGRPLFCLNITGRRRSFLSLNGMWRWGFFFLVSSVCHQFRVCGTHCFSIGKGAFLRRLLICSV